MFAFFPLVAKVWKLCSEKEPGRQTNYSKAPQSCHHLFIRCSFKHSFATEKIEIDLRRIIGIIGFDDELMTANTSL